MALDNIRLITQSQAEPSGNQNYINSITHLDEHESNGAIQQDIQYFDGLGRLSQEVNVFGSPAGHDIIKPVIYDEFGRIERSLLPYPEVNNGSPGSYRDFDWDQQDHPQEIFYQEKFFK